MPASNEYPMENADFRLDGMKETRREKSLDGFCGWERSPLPHWPNACLRGLLLQWI
jgi:hypothetical protein